MELLGKGICDGCGQEVEQLVAVDGAPLAGGALCLRCSDEGYLLELARELDEADRLGEGRDAPEGVRRVWFSDTLVRMIAARLREIVAQMGGRADDAEVLLRKWLEFSRSFLGSEWWAADAAEAGTMEGFQMAELQEETERFLEGE